MLTQIIDFLRDAVGYDPTWLLKLTHMMIRAFIIYLFGVSLARFNKKLLGVRTPFNFILFVMLGSIGANAIATKNFFLPTLGILIFLTFLNGLITYLAYHFPWVESFVKGSDVILIKDGKMQQQALQDELITGRELTNEMHHQLHTTDVNVVKRATLSSDGTINFIEKKN